MRLIGGGVVMRFKILQYSLFIRNTSPGCTELQLNGKTQIQLRNGNYS